MIDVGLYVNEAEAALVADVINRLYSIVGHEEMDSKIAVITPYRAQVDCITGVLRGQVQQATTAIQWARRDIKVCSVDSMQGSQRSVVIFSTTRSNAGGATGFVKDMRRLNASITRARYLDIIIADSKTMDTRGGEFGKGADLLRQVYNFALLPGKMEQGWQRHIATITVLLVEHI